ncbi:response regulator [Actinoplanes siamensis]|uniref:Response regulatory domain-containing protein n=1 Tax=Actinoplanes siamensis TaxID=1223317 RepID=A0A919NA18_9ACTN|nr:response regulator [Actinoplanes siamensis]GIF06995.1 hypothetical protein Asi03nite_45330 [Actinoplanes siamensis]
MDRPLIIVAEDDGDIRELLTLALEKAGYRVVGAGTGSAAARLLTTTRPSGLITDVRMPDMNGMELCRLARREHATRDIAILMFSASSHRHDIEAGLNAGADRYLPKPLRPRQIVAELEEVLAGSHQRSPAPSPGDHRPGPGGVFTLAEP